MEHNVFNFTIECSGNRNYPAVYYLYDYFADCADSKNNAYEIDDLSVKETNPGRWTVTFKLTTRDYGIPQVGMHLIGAYMRNVYEPIFEGDTEFIIDDCIFYHTSGRGARIDWDVIKSKPIVEKIERDQDQGQTEETES